MSDALSRSHEARKALFKRGLRQGFVTEAELEEAMPHDRFEPLEIATLVYSLQACGIEIRPGSGALANAG